MTSQPEGTPGTTRKLSVRRAPKYVPFMVAGGLAGVVTAAIFAFAFSSGEEFDNSSVFGLFTVLLILPGMGLGAVIALILDRQGRKKAETMVVESLPDDQSNPEAERA